MLSIVTAVQISDGKPYPIFYIGLQGAWPGLLWIGMYTEIWATFSAYYIRVNGAYYRESWWKKVVAGTLPFFLPIVAFVPAAVLFVYAAQGFNAAVCESLVLRGLLQGFQAEWIAEDGLDLVNCESVSIHSIRRSLTQTLFQ
jgi:hypothetical protein